MKNTLRFLALVFFVAGCASQPAEVRHDSVPGSKADTVVAFVPRGELIVSYEELGLYADPGEEHWVEIFLYADKDSIIVTEVEKLSKDSKERAAIYCFLASRAQLDLENIETVPHDLIAKPNDYLKVEVAVKDTSHRVTQRVNDPRSSSEWETLKITGIRVVVRDNAQAKEVMEKLRKDG